MKHRVSQHWLPALALGAMLGLASPSFAAETSGEKTTAKDVANKAGETAQALKNYTVEQRDEALKQAKIALDDLDRRIDRMQAAIDEKWDKMDQTARKRAKDTLAELRKERNDVAEWYGGLKHSSAEAWNDVRNGFAKSLDTLRDSFARARRQF